MLVNSERPYSKATQALTEKLAKEYGTSVMAVNCDQLRQEDILEILKNGVSVIVCGILFAEMGRNIKR